ncbi:glycosyltransferase [Clostridium estertheticum]|uniref:glycosyltransferase n=1 Tax=Clostridium estertheticum TaxID=238834 RepID=UPI001C7CA12A|nr:glycosyltransferase [Clostridium estertheticum]MBX4270559.1 glycosyltransferase [Clostridium estertheticum]WLC80085.1 glycosyltransferase [Clostridium estertheticum]
MSNKPFVSIIMSVYNEKEMWLSQSIESILKQTYKNFEFIIILDNPSNICLKNMIIRYQNNDNRIVFIENHENIGLTKSLNKGLCVCKGEFIARMDADDISLVNRLERQIKYLRENGNIDFIGTNTIIIDEQDNEIKRIKYIPNKSKYINKLLRFYNPMNHPTWMFKRELLKDLKEYRDIPFAEDYDFVCRAVTYGYKVANLNENLLKYRIRNNSICFENELCQIEITKYISSIYKSNKINAISNEKLFCDVNGILKKINNRKIQMKFEKGNDLFKKGLLFIKKGNVISAIYYFVKSIIKSKYILYKFNRIIKVKVINSFLDMLNNSIYFNNI